MTLIFDKLNCINIELDEALDTAVELSARDLARNVRDMSSWHIEPKVVRGITNESAIKVRTSATPCDGMCSEESYCVSVRDGSVYIDGSDTLGAIYGIFAVSTQLLGVTPSYRFTDVFPQELESLYIDDCIIKSRERKTRFRGWFLNDEDLLSDYLGGGGRRNIDYPYYQNVMRTDVLDMVLEYALRLEMNLVIPSSFVDITNPDEEALVEAVTRRGLFISQHHVEPLGVSYFAAENYIKAHGCEDEEVSFITNRSRMEEIWRHFASKWAKYGRAVIWQLGLRGRADRAVWQADPSVPQSDEIRGSIITDAITTEHKIVCEALGTSNFYSTVTLWMEGANLYGNGYIKTPKNSIVIFSDIGFNQMFGEDFYSTPRSPKEKYGIYYHVGYWGEGPHLCECTSPKKIDYCYKQAAANNSLYYSILNVSNVRPLHLGAELAARALCDPEGFNGFLALGDILSPIFTDSTGEVVDIYKEYFDAFADLGAVECEGRCKMHNFYYRKHDNLDFSEFCVDDGTLHEFGYTALTKRDYLLDRTRALSLIDESVRRFDKVIARIDKQIEVSTGCAREYLKKFTRFGAVYMREMGIWSAAVERARISNNKRKQIVLLNTAVASLNKIVDERAVLEQGAWQGWHDGECKIGIKKFIQLTNELIEKIEND